MKQCDFNLQNDYPTIVCFATVKLENLKPNSTCIKDRIGKH